MQVEPHILDEHVKGEAGAGIQSPGAQVVVFEIFVIANADGKTQQIDLGQRIAGTEVQHRTKDEVLPTLLAIPAGGVHVIIPVQPQRGADPQTEIAGLEIVRLGFLEALGSGGRHLGGQGGPQRLLRRRRAGRQEQGHCQTPDAPGADRRGTRPLRKKDWRNPFSAGWVGDFHRINGSLVI